MNYRFNWKIVLSGEYLQWFIEAIGCSLSLMLVSSLLALLLGLLVTFGNLSKNRLLHVLSVGYVELCRNIPTLIWLMFFFYVFPELFPERISRAMNMHPQLAYWAAVAGLAISSSGYISENFRSGIQSVHREQIAVAYSLGHSKGQIWRYVIWPQAMRSCFPALVTRIIHNAQNSSLAMALSVHEVMWTTRQIESFTFRCIEVTVIATVFYVLVNYGLGYLARLAEKHLLPRVS